MGVQRLVRRHGPRAAAAVAMAFWVSLPLPAAARDFTGVVQRIEKGADGVLVVDSRQGDELTFVRTPDTAVRGAKSDWDAIRRGDRVTVTWKMKDDPRAAHVVTVLPPRTD